MVTTQHRRTFPIMLLAATLMASSLRAQEQIDKSDARGRASAAVAKLSVRLRVLKAVPEQPVVRVAWRRGGEGLGGAVTRGAFTAEDQQPGLALGAWSAWLPLAGPSAHIIFR